MPEHDHDKLEDFFRKASIRAEVPFNEEDWNKLEARLDQQAAAGVPRGKSTSGKITTTVAIGIILLLTGMWWADSQYGLVNSKGDDPSTEIAGSGEHDNVSGTAHTETGAVAQAEEIGDDNRDDVRGDGPPSGDGALRTDTNITGDHATGTSVKSGGELSSVDEGNSPDGGEGDEGRPAVRKELTPTFAELPVKELRSAAFDIGDEKISRELIAISPANAEKIKQRANVDPPGAEEGDTGKAETAVSEEDASVKHATTPGLSLLLSFAPDFSSTSSRYSAPGKAFGAVIHYHVMPRWSVSAGVIRNSKRYTGDGEDYKPPVGYWKYYTNGVIPQSVDGSCDVVEFPLMVQYTIAGNGRHKWLAAAGTSSYLMLNESYRYKFEEPNPGAKEGWASKNTARFYFNMINITVGYERQVLPGLMIGVEPYVKIPLEEIGWSNIRLFSTGASFTLRYTLLGRKDRSMPIRSRAPD